MDPFTLIALAAILILIIPTLYASFIGAPLAISSRSRIKEIIKLAEIKPGEVFYELGTGTGRMISAVAKSAGAKTVGFELSPIFYALTWLNLRINGVKNSRLMLKNFFESPLGEADIVYFFLMPHSLEKLKLKLEKELRPGSRVISFAFPISGWTPFAEIKGNKKPVVYFYRIGPAV